MDGNFEGYFKINILMFALMGLRLTIDTKKNVKKTTHTEKLLVYITVIYGVYEFSVYIQDIKKTYKTKPMYAIQILVVFLATFSTWSRGFLLAMTKDNIQNLLRELSVMWEKYRPHDEHREKIIKFAGRSQLMCKIYFYHMILCIFTAIPTTVNIYNCYTTKSINYTCDFSIRIYVIDYPYEINTRFMYVAHSIKEEWIFVHYMLYWIACDSIFIQIMTHVLLQIKILKLDIMNTIDQEKNDDDLQKYLSTLIKRHQTILRICDQVERLFSLILFIIVTISSITLCLNIFGLQEFMRTSNYGDMFGFVFSILGLCYQILIYCVFTDMVTNEASSIANAVYNSKWTEKNYKCKMIFQIMIMKAQEPVYFTALKLFPMNLERVISLFKGAGSYYMMVRTMNQS